MSTTLGNLRINIQVDKSEFEKSITGLQRELTTAKTRFAAISTSTDKYQKSISDLGHEYKALEDVLKKQKALTDKSKQSWDELALSEGASAAKTQQMEQSYYRSIKAMNSTQLQMEELEKAINGMISEQEKAIDEAHKMALEEENLRKSMQEITKVHTSFGNAWKKSTDAMKTFGKNTIDLGKNIRQVSGNIARDFGAMTLAVGGVFGLATKSAMDFEKQLSNVKAVAGATPEQMQKLQDQAMKLGSSTQYSATQVAEAQEELIKAGVSLDTVLGDGLKGTLDLASAGELSLGDAAVLASTALNSFKDEALTTTQAADVLAGVSNATAADINGLKDGLAQSSAVASVMGMSFEDTAKSLGLFAQNGLTFSPAMRKLVA